MSCLQYKKRSCTFHVKSTSVLELKLSDTNWRAYIKLSMKDDVVRVGLGRPLVQSLRFLTVLDDHLMHFLRDIFGPG